jgi:hypothetical protein
VTPSTVRAICWGDPVTGQHPSDETSSSCLLGAFACLRFACRASTSCYGSLANDKILLV